MAQTDPIVEKRNRIRTMAQNAQRLSYLLLGIATLLFFIGLGTELNDLLVTAIIALLIGGSIILAIAIQVVYAIKGAERHEEDSAAQRPHRR